jgi:hypothetical protein
VRAKVRGSGKEQISAAPTKQDSVPRPGSFPARRQGSAADHPVELNGETPPFTKTEKSHATRRGVTRLLHSAGSSSAARPRFRSLASISGGASSALLGGETAHPAGDRFLHLDGLGADDPLGPDPGHHPFYAWIRVGLEIYEGLSDLYPVYRGGDALGHAAEIFPHATAALLAGELPLSSGDKVEFRRRVLRERGIAEGQLPTPDQVDAALGALTGLIALMDGHDSVGDPDEGVILLPVPDVPQAPLRRRGLPSRTPSRAAPSRPSPSPRRPGATVQIGYENRNGQTVVAATGLPGTDHGQSVYVLRCRRCGAEYGCNGSDNFQRKCPRCQGGAPGLAYS